MAHTPREIRGTLLVLIAVVAVICGGCALICLIGQVGYGIGDAVTP